MGHRQDAEAVWQEFARLSEHTHDATLSVGVKAHAAYLAFLDGQLETARSLCESARAEPQTFGVFNRVALAGRLLFLLGQGGSRPWMR